MKSFFKKLLSTVLMLILSTSMINIPLVRAEEQIDGWNIKYSNSSGSAAIDNKVFYNGNGSLKVVNDTPYGPDQYVMLSSTVHVKAGRIYYMGGHFKAENVPNLYMCVDWGARYEMTTFGKTYDWKNFTTAYAAKESKNVTFQIIIDNKCDALWLDDMKFTDAVTGENLLSNSNFDSVDNTVASEDNTVIPSDGSMDSIYNSIINGGIFDVNEMQQVIGGFKFIPVYKEGAITIDGNADDWEKYQSIAIPTLSSQYIVYIKDDRKLDMSANLKFTYDDDNLYMLIEVSDDIFYYKEGGQNEYWQGDSIQLAWSAPNETYGSEIGLAYNPKTKLGEIYSTAYSDEQMANMRLSASQEGNKTTYELSMPWTLKFDKRPDELQFCVIANDNDGDGRRYCIELAPGIASGKTNAQFPTLKMCESSEDWYGWIQADKKSAMQNDELSFDYFLVNKGEEKTFSVTNLYTNETESITVPTGKGIHRNFKIKFDTFGTFDVGVNFNDGEKDSSSLVDVEIERIPADAQTSENILKNIKSQTAEIKSLIEKCVVKGIKTQYEDGYYFIMDRFCTYTEEEINRKDYSRINYTAEAFDELYNICKTNLNAYLDGSKTPDTVPMYITSDLRIDGKSMYATVDNNGVNEERPVFFVGYLGYEQQQEDTPFYNIIGANSAVYEPHMGVTRYSPSVFNGWQLQRSNAPEATAERCEDTKRDGDLSAKIVYSSEQSANQFLALHQTIDVTPGKTYVLKGYVKGKGVKGAWLSANGFDDREYISGDYDWKEVKTAITVPEERTSTTIYICVENQCDALYFDGFTFCEEGSDEDLLENGSFDYNDEISDEDFAINPNFSLDEYLTVCDESNVALEIALGPHVFPDDLIKKYNIPYTGQSFIQYNICYPEAKAAVEKHIRAVMEALNGHKSVHTIVLSNEFDFRTSYLADYFMEDWHNYLKERYNNDINALNEAYTTEHTSFDEIDFHLGSAAKKYDYKKFNDRVCADWHRWMADIVHEYLPDISVSCKHMGYLSDNTEHAGLLSNGTGMEDYIDFCDLNGCDYWNYYNDNHGPLVKNMWYDYLVSLKNAPVFNSEDHIIKDASENFVIENDNYVAQDIYQGAIHGRGRSDIWAWYRDYQKGASLNNSILFRVGAVAKVSKAALDLNKNVYEITALQNEATDIGILYDDASAVNDNTVMQAIYQAYSAATFSGKRVRFVVESQPYKMNECRLMIIPNQKYVKKELVSELRKFIEDGGKVLILGEDSLKLTEKNLPNSQDDLDYIFSNSIVMPYVGFADHMASPTKDELYSTVRNTLKELGLYTISVVDTVTGNPVDDVEYNVGIYNGKLIINLVNYEADKNVKIYVGDKLLEKARELRDNYEIGSEISLKKYMPITLEAEIDNHFLDTIGHWAEDSIVALANDGIIYGISDSRFAPNRSISRVEILALLMRKMGIDSTDKYTTNVPDVNENDWFAGVIQAAVKNGIIEENKNFRPNEKATREEMCELLVKCYEKQHGAISDYKKITFEDCSEMTDETSISKAVEKGLMVGISDNIFAPQSTATRAEAATILSRFN